MALLLRFSIICLTLWLPIFAHAQKSGPVGSIEEDMHKRILAYVEDSKIESFREHIGKKLPEFRYVKTPEITSQPEKYDILAKISDINKKGYVITVHDRKTGAPLYSCLSPCELKIKKPKKRFIVFYKEGHSPHLDDILRNKRYYSSLQLYLPVDFFSLNYYTSAYDLKKCSKRVGQSLITCIRPIDTNRNPWSRHANGYGKCTADFDVTAEGNVRNVRNVQCDNLKLCYNAFRHIKKTYYFATGEPYTKSREISFSKTEQAKKIGNDVSKNIAKQECFPAL